MTDQIVEMPVVTTSEPVAVPSSPLRAQYDVWVATMADIRAVNPGIIVDIISPDSLNNGLTLEQIDARWNELQSSAEPSMLDFYETFRDYLAMPRFIDTFDHTTNGHSKRRDFRRKITADNPQFYNTMKTNDLRLCTITGVLGMIELFGMDTGDQNLLIKHAAFLSEIRDPDDTDHRERYSRMSMYQKLNIADNVRSLARDLYFKDVKKADTSG